MTGLVLSPRVLLNHFPVLTLSSLRNIWILLVFALLTACGGPVARVDLQNTASAGKSDSIAPQVLIVTLTGKLGTTELARCHRSIREAENHGCSHVIFRMETAGSQGENLSELQSLMDRVQSTDVATVAVLRGHVTQGAAALALCTTSTYLLQGAKWGEIAKPEKDIEIELASDPEAAQNQLLDSIHSMIKGRLDKRRNKLRPDAAKLALAMADPRVQLISATVREGGIERPRVIDQAELTALQQAGATILGEQRMERPLMVTPLMAEEYGLSNGTLSGYDQLFDLLNLDRNAVGELQENWAEHMVGWLELLQPFLLVAGFLLLLLEVKTPGTGLPGLLAVVFLALAMFYSYLVGLAEVTEILVFFLGLVAIAVEIFVLPGTVVFGLVGFLCLVLALVLSRQSFVLPSNVIEEQILLWNLASLVFLFVLVAVLGWLMWRLLPNVPVFNRLMLVPPGSGLEPVSNTTKSELGLRNDRLVQLVGRTGRAATLLRPTGAMEIDNDRIDVITEGEFVEQGTMIRVLYVQGNRVVVAPDHAPGGGDSAGDAREGERGSVGLVVLLCVIGLALIVAEVIFVSMGLIGIAAAGCLLTAIFVAFQESIGFGILMSIFEAFAAPVVVWGSFKLLPKTPFGKRLILTGPPTDGRSAAGDARLGELLHKEGITLSTLRPTGFARIDERRVDVVTRGEMLPKDCEVVVLDVSGNRVVVGQKQTSGSGSRDSAAN